MPKVKVQATKLENPRVSFISLVHRGANRIPFRIIKLDKGTDDMAIDLNRIFRTKKEEAPTQEPPAAKAATLLGLVVEKHDHTEAVTGLLKEHGFNTENVTESGDGSLVLAQTEITKEDLFDVVRLSDHVLALVKDFPKDQLPESIAKHAETDQFLQAPSDYISAVSDLMADPENIAKAEALMGETSAYSKLFFAAIPEELRKADESIRKMMYGKKKKLVKDDDDVSDDDGTSTPDPVEGAPNEGAAATTPVAKADDNKDPPKDEGKDNLSRLEAAVATLVQKVDALAGTFDGKIEDLATRFTALTSTTEQLSTKLKEVETVAKAADDKLTGTVIGAKSPPSREDSAKVVKSEGGEMGPIDTAYMRRDTAPALLRRRSS